MQKLLIIDDEPNLLYSMSRALQRESVCVLTAESAGLGIRMVREETPDAVILDVRLPDRDGLELFSQIREHNPRLPVIIITAVSTMEVAVEAMKRGAYEFLVKPIELNRLRELVNAALEITRLSDSHEIPVVDAQEHRAEHRLIGDSPPMQEVFKSIGRVAPQDITVLIHGESGTGKELIAQALYEHSARSDRPFLAINCAAIQETILESELFGHERGAFTGADRLRVGKFEQVDGGTLFLDEVGDMSPATQAKVLRMLQDGSFQRVGSNETRRANVRIIAATNRNLAQLTQDGLFREDLYFRLRGFVIEVPPLRDRMSDLPALVNYYVRRFNHELERHVRAVSPEAMRCLETYDWPGNVRELQTVVRYALLHAVGDTITSGSLPGAVRGESHTATRNSLDWAAAFESHVERALRRQDGNVYRDIHSEVDRLLLPAVLEFVDGSQVQAAQVLGISRTTLRNRLQELELNGSRDACPKPVQVH